jgi:hypothetical protein
VLAGLLLPLRAPSPLFRLVAFAIREAVEQQIERPQIRWAFLLTYTSLLARSAYFAGVVHPNKECLGII